MARFGRRRNTRENGETAAEAEADGPSRRERVGAGAASGAGGLLRLLAGVIDIVIGIIALIIVAGILFVVLKANAQNTIVKDIHDAAKFFVGPFDRLFTPKDHRLEIAINWGIAAAVYVIVGRFVASLLRRSAPDTA